MQEALGSSGRPMQVPEGPLKSEELLPPRLMEVIVAGAFPELITVTVWMELAEPCESAGKFTVVGKNVNAGPLTGLTSVPVRVMDCGLPVALSAKMSAA
jgi:hypothetical protein